MKWLDYVNPHNRVWWYGSGSTPCDYHFLFLRQRIPDGKSFYLRTSQNFRGHLRKGCAKQWNWRWSTWTSCECIVILRKPWMFCTYSLTRFFEAMVIAHFALWTTVTNFFKKKNWNFFQKTASQPTMSRSTAKNKFFSLRDALDRSLSSGWRKRAFIARMPGFNLIEATAFPLVCWCETNTFCHFYA